MKELIRMNQLAGVITESQAKKMLTILNEEKAEKVLKEKLITFSFTYNDADYIKRLFKKTGVDVKNVEIGTFDDEIDVTVDKINLKKAKQVLKNDGFDLS